MPYIPHYQNTPEYKRLIRLLPSLDGNEKVTESQLNTLLRIVGARHTIRNCLLVFENLQVITTKAPQICIGPQWHFAAEIIVRASRPCSILLDEKNRIKLRLKIKNLDILPKRKWRNDSFYGDIEHAILYTTTGHLAYDANNREKYYQLITQILVVYLLGVHKGQAGRLYPRLDDALKAIRSIANEWTSYPLSLLPEELLTPECYLSQLKQIIEPTSLREITKFIEKSLSLFQTLESVGPKIFGPITVLPRPKANLKSEPDEPDLPEVYEEIDHPEDDEGKASPGWVFVFPQGGRKDGIPTEFGLTAQQAANTRARENQLFPYAWSAPNQYDLQILFQHLFPPGLISNPETLKTSIQLGFSFLVGMSLETVADLIVCQSEDIPSDVNVLIAPTNTLRLISPGPKLKTKLDPMDLLQAHPKQNFIDLDLPDYFARHVTSYLSAIKHPYPTAPLFNDSPGEVINDCKKIISFLKRHTGTRLTLDRIQNYIVLRLANMDENDVAGASLTTGRDIYLARTRNHYCAPDSYTLRRLCNKAWHDIALEAGRKSSYIEAFPDLNTLHLGTPIRPQESSVQAVVEKLIKFIESKKASIQTLEGLVEYHNALTLYTALLIAYSTGYRAINTPFITDDMYDEHTGFAVIRDKDSADYYHSRLVWLTSFCIQHLKNYQRHIELLGVSKNTSATKVSGKDNEFFFLASDGRRKHATRKEIGEHLKSFGFLLPPNTQRHFLRSELQENGCPVEVIEIMLGHWHLGQEGWTKESAIHPWDFKSELSKHLPPLLSRLGFKSIKGLETRPKLVLPLNEWATKATKLERTRRRGSTNLKADTFLDEDRPGRLWYDLLNERAQEKVPTKAFNAQQKIVLNIVRKLAPDLYHAPLEELPPLPEKKVQQIIRWLTPKRTNPRSRFLRLNFFIRGLENAAQKYGCKVDVPPRPVWRPKGYNRVRPQVMQRLKIFRKIEKAFLKEQKTNLPNQIELRVGRILFSAVLYGALNHRAWAAGFLRGLDTGTFQYGEALCVDLWSHPQDSELQGHARWLYQRDPSRYRRWHADPYTQALIYAWRENHPGDRKTCRKLSLDEVFNAYLSYLKEKASLEAFAPETLETFLAIGNAHATLTLPPYLSAYAEGSVQSASLPDPAMLRINTGKNIPVGARSTPTGQTSRTKRIRASENQQDLLNELRRIIPADNTRWNQPEAIKKDIKRFLETNDGKLCDTLELLARWAMQLLSDRQSALENRKKRPERPKTVSTYLGKFSDELLAVFENYVLLELDDDELCALLMRVVKKIEVAKRSGGKVDDIHARRRISSAIGRLNQFLGYQTFFHGMPELRIVQKNGVLDISVGGFVRANLFTETEYRNLLHHLGWGRADLSRPERMTLVATILAFRCSLRTAEIYGLLIGDIQGTDRKELLVRPNFIRGLKTSNAKRREPLYAQLTPEEFRFVDMWHQFRKTELGATSHCPLFTFAPLFNDAYDEKLLFAPLRQFLKWVTDDDTMVPYTFRHSFYTWLSLKLSLRNDIDLGQMPFFLQEQVFSKDACDELRRHLLTNDKVGRKSLYSSTVLMGHAEPGTGLHHYMHMCDWMTWYFHRHPSCAPALKATLLKDLIGRSKETAHRTLQKEDKHPLLAHIRRKAKIHATELAHPLLSMVQDQPLLLPVLRNDKGMKLLPFDIALHRFCSKKLPGHLKKLKKPIDVWSVGNLYSLLANLDQKAQKRLARTAKMMFECFNPNNGKLKFTNLRNTKRALHFMQAIGIGRERMDIRYHGSRWVTEDVRENSLNIWRERLGIKIQAGKHLCRLKDKSGYLSIEIESIKIYENSVFFDHHFSRIFAFFLALLAGSISCKI